MSHNLRSRKAKDISGQAEDDLEVRTRRPARPRKAPERYGQLRTSSDNMPGNRNRREMDDLYRPSRSPHSNNPPQSLNTARARRAMRNRRAKEAKHAMKTGKPKTSSGSTGPYSDRLVALQNKREELLTDEDFHPDNIAAIVATLGKEKEPQDPPPPRPPGIPPMPDSLSKLPLIMTPTAFGEPHNQVWILPMMEVQTILRAGDVKYRIGKQYMKRTRHWCTCVRGDIKGWSGSIECEDPECWTGWYHWECLTDIDRELATTYKTWICRSCCSRRASTIFTTLPHTQLWPSQVTRAKELPKEISKQISSTKRQLLEDSVDVIAGGPDIFTPERLQHAQSIVTLLNHDVAYEVDDDLYSLPDTESEDDEGRILARPAHASRKPRRRWSQEGSPRPMPPVRSSSPSSSEGSLHSIHHIPSEHGSDFCLLDEEASEDESIVFSTDDDSLVAPSGAAQRQTEANMDRESPRRQSPSPSPSDLSDPAAFLSQSVLPTPAAVSRPQPIMRDASSSPSPARKSSSTREVSPAKAAPPEKLVPRAEITDMGRASIRDLIKTPNKAPATPQPEERHSVHTKAGLEASARLWTTSSSQVIKELRNAEQFVVKYLHEQYLDYLESPACVSIISAGGVSINVSADRLARFSPRIATVAQETGLNKLDGATLPLPLVSEAVARACVDYIAQDKFLRIAHPAPPPISNLQKRLLLEYTHFAHVLGIQPLMNAAMHALVATVHRSPQCFTDAVAINRLLDECTFEGNPARELFRAPIIPAFFGDGQDATLACSKGYIDRTCTINQDGVDALWKEGKVVMEIKERDWDDEDDGDSVDAAVSWSAW